MSDDDLEEGSSGVNLELQRNSAYRANVVEEIVKMDRKIFPEHESRAAFFDEELNKKDSELLYLEIDKDIVGYVMCSRASSACAYILVLAVKEKYRKQGHGEALMKAAIDTWIIGEVEGMSLHVDPLNTAAMSLYFKLGFQVDELIQGYYSPDRSAYRMFLEAESDL